MTKLEIYNNAHAFAGKTLEEKSKLELMNKVVKHCTPLKLDKAGFDFWNSTFNTTRSQLLRMLSQEASGQRKQARAARNKVPAPQVPEPPK